MKTKFTITAGISLVAIGISFYNLFVWQIHVRSLETQWKKAVASKAESVHGHLIKIHESLGRLYKSTSHPPLQQSIEEIREHVHREILDVEGLQGLIIKEEQLSSSR